MFTFTPQDVLQFYGNKFLFLPENRGESIGVLQKEELIKGEIKPISPEKVAEPVITLEKPIIKEGIKPISPEITPEPVILLEKPAIKTPPPAEKITSKPYESGEKVQWKMRPNVPCKVIVIVSIAEFKNTVLMGALLFMMEEKCKINRTSISFGTYQAEQATWNLSDMPAQNALLFTDIETQNAVLGDKKIQVLPSISKIALNIPLQEMAMTLMKAI